MNLSHYDKFENGPTDGEISSGQRAAGFVNTI